MKNIEYFIKFGKEGEKMTIKRPSVDVEIMETVTFQIVDISKRHCLDDVLERLEIESGELEK